MRSRFVAVALVLALGLAALLLVGCGGSTAEEPTTTDTTAQAPATPAAPANAAAAVAPVVDRSPAEEVVYEPFPTDPQVTPEPVLQLLQAKQPMIVYFYDATQKMSNDEKEGVDGKGGLDVIMSDYRGAIDLVSFDVGKFVKTGSTGKITVDPAFSDSASGQQTAALAAELGVDFTPYLVIVDGDGYIIARFRGWEDTENIEREVLRATS